MTFLFFIILILVISFGFLFFFYVNLLSFSVNSLSHFFFIMIYCKKEFHDFYYFGQYTHGKGGILGGSLQRPVLPQINSMSMEERLSHLEKFFSQVPCSETPPNMSREEYLEVWSYWRMCYYYRCYPVIDPHSPRFIISCWVVISGCCILIDHRWKRLPNFEEVLTSFLEFYKKCQLDNRVPEGASWPYSNVLSLFKDKYGL